MIVDPVYGRAWIPKDEIDAARFDVVELVEQNMVRQAVRHAAQLGFALDPALIRFRHRDDEATYVALIVELAWLPADDSLVELLGGPGDGVLTGAPRNARGFPPCQLAHPFRPTVTGDWATAHVDVDYPQSHVEFVQYRLLGIRPDHPRWVYLAEK